jgi:hypothetical protein
MKLNSQEDPLQVKMERHQIDQDPHRTEDHLQVIQIIRDHHLAIQIIEDLHLRTEGHLQVTLTIRVHHQVRDHQEVHSIQARDHQVNLQDRAQEIYLDSQELTH